ncbi:hypothetical protein CRG98_003788 [Punica granatum]|uniref:DUF7745 domain-containing protein n=1 Tax=Punica granatum TaxID=22663 RepID=A0A2I0L5I0_PUNGR|nr:hypothetical protein CRG98_003788 [Punica granatum]
MSHSASFPRLDKVTPSFEQINHIWTSLRQIDRDYITAFVGDVPVLSTRRVDWNFLGAAVTFWDPTHDVFNIQGTELTLIIEEYQTFIGRTAVAQGIVEPNHRTTRLVLVSHLLRVHRSQLHVELAYSGGTEIVTTKLLCFIESRARKVRGDIFQANLCHVVLFLIFETLLFPSAANCIDTALVSVVLQVVGGRGYEVTLVAETIRSLDRITRTTDRRLRGSPILLQIWLQSHASPFGLVRPVLFFNRSESIILRLLPLVRVEERKHTKISPALHNLRVAHHMGHPQLRVGSSKWNSLASGPRGTAFVERSPRKMSNSSISASFKGSSPKHTPSYKDAIRSWHVRTLPWRGSRRGPMEISTHLSIDTSTRLLLGIGAFHGNGQLRPKRDGRST